MDPVEQPLPRQTRWMFHWFQRYCVRYARKRFHSVRLSRTSAEIPKGDGEPLIFVMNHPSWWDIILGFILSARYPHYQHFAPIEAEMLSKYRIFARLGMFGIDSNLRGAARFLQVVEAMFAESHRAMWITAQGRFVDPRVRPIALRSGVGYVAGRIRRGWIIPVAVEYPFWDESTPEALIRFGTPLAISPDASLSGREWTRRIETALTQAQDVLALEAMTRDANAFVSIVAGRSGIGGVYDSWRRLKSWFHGKRFDPAHRAQTSDETSV